MNDSLKEILNEVVTTIRTEMKDMKSDITEMKSELKEMKSDISHMKSEMKVMKLDINHMKSEMKVMKSDINHMKSEINDIRSDLNDTKQKMHVGFGRVHSEISELKQGQQKIESKLDTFNSNMIKSMGDYTDKIISHFDDSSEVLNKRVFKVEKELHRSNKQ